MRCDGWEEGRDRRVLRREGEGEVDSKKGVTLVVEVQDVQSIEYLE